MLGIEKTRTTNYEPRSDGIIERYHRTMNAIIGKVVSYNHRNCHDVLLTVAAAFRASVHESTSYSPNYLVFGREIRMPVEIVYGSVDFERSPESTQYLQELRDTLTYAYELVLRKLAVTAERRKKKYDMNVRVKHLSIGDKVWVFVHRKRHIHYPK